MASCENSSKFLQGWSIKSISNHVLQGFSKWHFIYPEFKGSQISYCWVSYTPQQCSLFTSYFFIGLSHSLIHACPWLMELMSDAGMCSDQWTQLTQGSTGSCQVIQQDPICIKQIQDSRLSLKELTTCVIRKQRHCSCGCGAVHHLSCV